MNRRCLLVLSLLLLPRPLCAAQPDLVSLGIGWFDVLDNRPQVEAAELRGEYRWGLSLLSAVNKDLSSWDAYFQLHPFAGAQVSSRGQHYVYGGFVYDFLLGKHVVFSPSTAFGLYGLGAGKDLGSIAEFRSTLELGWRFDSESRLTGYFGHISNAKLARHNAGANQAGVYLHMPVSALLEK